MSYPDQGVEGGDSTDYFKGGKSKGKGKGLRYNCGGKEHIARDCTAPQKGKGKGQKVLQPGFKGKGGPKGGGVGPCFGCGKLGHIQANCWAKGKGKGKGGGINGVETGIPGRIVGAHGNLFRTW